MALTILQKCDLIPHVPTRMAFSIFLLLCLSDVQKISWIYTFFSHISDNCLKVKWTFWFRGHEL